MEVLQQPFNPELMEILDPFTTWFFERDKKNLKLNGQADGKSGLKEEHTDAAYLVEMKKKTNLTGYPEKTYGVDMGQQIDNTPHSWRKTIIQLDSDLNIFFGSAFSAVKMYYPPKGFMGWHCNANCPGFNIIMSYTKTGKGWFRYQDPISGKLITLKDKPGWNAKVAYFGHWKEPDKIVWHCARANGEERLTLAYVIPHEEMWKMMCDDIVVEGS